MKLIRLFIFPGLCPPPDPEDDLGKTSSVEDLPDPIPDLFNVLTEQEDFHQRWTTFTFAVDLDKLLYKPQIKPSQKTKVIPGQLFRHGAQACSV